MHFGLICSSLCLLERVGSLEKSKTNWAQGMGNQSYPQVENEVQRQRKWMGKKSQRKRDVQMRSGRCQHSLNYEIQPFGGLHVANTNSEHIILFNKNFIQSLLLSLNLG